MGLFDFFKPRATSNATDEPRPDHAAFAHQVLRDAAFQNPAHCVTTLASPSGREYLNDLWQAVRSLCEDGGQPARVNPDDILVHRVRAGSYPCTVLELPTPERATEAFFVALVLLLDMSDQNRAIDVTPLRYLTLELIGHRDDDGIEALIGEWTLDEQHLILGRTSDVTLEGFVSQVSRLTARRHLD